MAEAIRGLDMALDDVVAATKPSHGPDRGDRSRRSRDAGAPYQTRGVCFTCGKPGHRASECRAGGGGGGGGGCFTCGKPGHRAAECREGGGGGGGGGGGNCFTCGGFGHRAAECPNNRGGGGGGGGGGCFTCGKPGHRAAECREGGGGGGGRGSGDSSCRVYVGNLAYGVAWQDLKDHMREAGEVTHADVMQMSDGRSKGCGVVTYSSPVEARRAITSLHDTELQGRLIFVREDRD